MARSGLLPVKFFTASIELCDWLVGRHFVFLVSLFPYYAGATLEGSSDVPGKPRRLRHWFWSAIVLVAVSGTWLSANAQTVTPEQVSAALPALDAMAQDVVSSGAVPGLAIAVVSHDKVVFLKGYGLREAGRPETVDADTVFQLASLSKPISSSVVAALVTAGVVRWDLRISDLDPGFRLFDAYPTEQVTVRDLFAHRSGLPGSAGDDLETIGFDRKTIAYRLRLVPPSSSFRAGYSYSNFGLTEGAVAAARPTGKDWETVAEDFLYRPLGMTMTSSRYSDFVARTDRAALHIKVNGAWAAKLQRDPDAQSPAGGVSSSVRDLAQWVRLELGDGMFDGTRLISSDAIGETHQPLVARGNNLVTGAASFYALGWNVEYGRHGLSWGHAGAFSLGARTPGDAVSAGGFRHRGADQCIPDRRARGYCRQLCRPGVRWSRCKGLVQAVGRGV